VGIKVGVNPPKTPVTEGSSDIAPTSVPGIYKLPGPPPPFVPGPLPNVGKSGDSPAGYTSTVKIEGNTVAIEGASYKSTGSPDVASKGTGGGMVSATEEGKTEFAAPGSMNVKAEGKQIQLFTDAMTNDDKNGGTTLPGNIQDPETPDAMSVLQAIVDKCENSVPANDANGKKKSCTKLGAEKHACCEKAIQDHRNANPPDGKPPVDGEKGYKRPTKREQRKKKPGPPTSIPGSRAGIFAAARDGAIAALAGMSLGAKAAKKFIGKAIGKALGGKCFPDAAIINPDGSKTMVDFKFPCPKGHPSGKGTSKGGVSTAMSPEQQGAYDAISKGTCDGPTETILPSQLSFGF
jgi:hypothetical protein